MKYDQEKFMYSYANMRELQTNPFWFVVLFVNVLLFTNDIFEVPMIGIIAIALVNLMALGALILIIRDKMDLDKMAKDYYEKKK